MGDRWEPPGYGPQQGGQWGPQGGGPPPTGPSPQAGGATPGGFEPGGYTPGGYTPGGYTPGGYSPGGGPAGGGAPGGGAPGGYSPPGWSPQGADQPVANSWPPAPGDGDGFGDTQLIGRPPFVWLIIALVLGLVAAAVAWFYGASMWIALGAWALAGPVAIGLLAVFTQRDVQQRAKPIYDAPSWIPVLYWSTIAAAALGIALSAWNIAEWAGRL